MRLTRNSTFHAFIFVGWLAATLTAQETTRFNLDMDQVVEGDELPKGWDKVGNLTFETKEDSKNSKNKFVSVQSQNPRGLGVIRYFIPAKYAGEKVTLTARLKLDDVTGRGGVSLRIVFFKGQRQIAREESTALSGTSEWKDYSVSIDTPTGADRFAVVGFLNGKGTASFDEFRVTVDGKEVEGTTELPAEADDEFVKGSGIAQIALDKESVASLELLGRVWGYVKYHHPTVAAGKVNWDYELFRVLPKYTGAKTSEGRERVLVEWIDGLGEFELVEEAPEKRIAYKLTPDVRWLENLENSRLAKKLKALANAKRSEKHFYVGFANKAGNPIFNEAAYSQFEYPDAGFRLLSLFRYWNIIQYYFPYRALTDNNWNDVLAEFIPRFANAKDALDYRLAAMELISSVADTHAQLSGPDEVIADYRGTRQGALQLRFIDEQLTVVGYIDKKSVDKTKIRVGDVIIAINEMDINGWMKKHGRYYWASNRPTKLRLVAQNILRTNDKQVALTFRRGKETYSATIPSLERAQFNKAISEQRQEIEPWKILEGDIGYLYSGSLTPADVQQRKLGMRLSDRKGLVIDLRCYPSQFIVFSVGYWLMPKATDFVKFSRPDSSKPGAFEIMPGSKVGRSNPRYFKGKVAILVDERTLSQAEYTAMALRVAPHAKVFGSTTAGADGNVSTLILPGDVKTAISGLGVYTPEGKDTQRIGIIPDVRVEATLEGILAGKDEVLDAALKWIGEKKQ